jgi:hypothetical protein
MIHPVAQVRSAVAHARFDPRAVLVGLVLMFLAALGGWGLAGVTASKADKVITPVAEICSQRSAASAELANLGTCAAANDARRAGPYVITRAGAPGDAGAPGTPGKPGGLGAPGTPGTPGVNGTNGTNGLAGQNGTNGVDGLAGTNGVDGLSPPCLAEPAMCQGRDGRDGVDGQPGRDGVDGQPGRDGAQGPPGPTCPEGTSLQPVQFASGQQGLGCVSEEPAPTTDPGTE